MMKNDDEERNARWRQSLRRRMARERRRMENDYEENNTRWMHLASQFCAARYSVVFVAHLFWIYFLKSNSITKHIQKHGKSHKSLANIPQKSYVLFFKDFL